MTPETLFDILSHELRWEVVTHLLSGPKNVTHLLELVDGISQPNLSQHLAKMRRAGVVIAERKNQHVYYSLANNQIKNVVRCAMREFG